ncbi:hypothetical protein DFP72DRAFT_813987, partial [Ephemerocybe angulata]
VDRVVWLEKEIVLHSLDDVEREMTREVQDEALWELHEANFRLELLMIDKELRPDEWKIGVELPAQEKAATTMERELFLRRVFPVVDGQHSGFFVTAIPNVDKGLASIDWRERAHHVLALREVLVSWPDCPSSIVDASLEMSEGVMRVLERLVVGEYCRTVHSLLGRPPTAPVRLAPISLTRSSLASFYSRLSSDQN